MRRLAALVLICSLAAGACSGGSSTGSQPTGSRPSGTDAPATSGAGPSSAGSTLPDLPTGPWSYRDGSGVTTRLDAVPVRIVAAGAAAAALIPLGIRPVGIFADTPVTHDLALSHLDLGGIKIVGEQRGVIDVAAVAALQPDLIVTEWWPDERTYTGFEDPAGPQAARLREIAPVVGVARSPSVSTIIGDYEALAESLGADLSAPDVLAAQARLDTAIVAFQAALAAKPDLTVLAVSPASEGLYIGVPQHSGELSDFLAWGMHLVVPNAPDPDSPYFERLPWTGAAKYQADLLLVDDRGYPDNLELAKQKPAWATLLAGAADSIALWPAFWVRNDNDYATALELLTAAVAASNEHVYDPTP